MKVVLFVFNMFLMVVLASCGGYDSIGISDSSSEEAKKYEILQALDKGEYDFVISALEEDPAYGEVFTEEERKLNLAAAYLGKAGYDYVDIINKLIEADEDPSKSLIKAFATRASGKTIKSLDKALALYKDIKPNNCTDAETFYEKEACFYYGLVSSVQASTGLALAIGGLIADNETDIATTVEYWLSENEDKNCSIDVNQNGVPDGADISACAIEFGAKFNGTEPRSYNCTNNSTVNYIKEIEFEGINKNFIYVKITVPAQGACSESKTEEILMTQTEDGVYAPAITDGFCYTSFDSCNQNDQNCYPCPVIVEDKVLDMNEVILESINNADALTEVIGEEGGEGEEEEGNELSEQLVEMKKEICKTNPEACSCNGGQCNNDTLENATDITIENMTVITDYLLNQ